jgi:hypothetical protein
MWPLPSMVPPPVMTMFSALSRADQRLDGGLVREGGVREVGAVGRAEQRGVLLDVERDVGLQADGAET